MPATLTFNADGREFLEAMANTLTQRGFTVVRSFDLQDSRRGLADTSGSQAVSETSAVQYAVLLVYGSGAEPLPVIVSGWCGCTEVCVPHDGDTRVAPDLAETVVEILAELPSRGRR